MSASLSTLAPLHASSSELVSGSAAMLDPASAGAGDTGPFAALLHRAMGKQIAEDIDPKLLNLIGELAGNTAPDGSLDANAEDALAALLPFLEGMGLLPPDAPAATAPITPAIQTMETSAGDELAARTGSDSGMPAKSAVAALTSGTGDLPSTSAGDAENSAPLGTNRSGAAGTAMTPNTTAPDSRFATQLKAAMEPVAQASTPTSASMAAGSTATATASAPGQPQHQVAQPVGANGWSEEVGNHVVLMSNRREDRAELVLTPPQMGRVQVSLTISGDQASASFVSANPVVREALEAALPRLREMLAESGIQLGQAQVGAENSRQMTQRDENGGNSPADRGQASEKEPRLAATNAESGMILKPGRGLVDVFA